MLCIEISISLGSLQIFEGAAREFKGILGSQLPLILSPEVFLKYSLIDNPNPRWQCLLSKVMQCVELTIENDDI